MIGHQIGHGDGKTAATVIAGAGGAFAGNEAEKNVKKTVRYEVRVTMGDGSMRYVSMNERPDVAVGQRVRVVNGAVVPN